MKVIVQNQIKAPRFRNEKEVKMHYNGRENEMKKKIN